MPARIRRTVNIAGALVVAAVLLLALGAGYGPLPALGPELAPGQGVWASAAADTTAHDETIRVPGLSRPATVSFDSDGYTSVTTATDDDLFLAQGYVAARFRLTQLDLERRAGEGRLARLNGAAAVPSDEFELRLGLLRTAQAEWSRTAHDSPAGRALLAYAQGVNDWLAELDGNGQWPPIYGLTGTRPARWTPVDSLVVQEVLTQQLDFSTIPLDYALLTHSLGPRLTMAWFPVRQPTTMSAQPYDPGPYPALPPAPLASPNANAAAVPGLTAARVGQGPVTDAATSAGTILRDVRDLPVNQQDLHPDSNAWAVNGPEAAGGGAILSGDPHLQLSLPSYWFEVSLRSPGYDVAGASLPGLPGVVLGHNRDISWSITNTENQATLFYTERTDPAHPNQYYWRGAWEPERHVHYRIDVRGSSPVDLDVGLTVHGPIMTVDGQTESVTWMGNYPSPDVAALLSLNRARDFTGFRSALRDWQAPALNFVYADHSGNIGALGAGYYPQTPAGSRPWLPMPGTGADDVTGTIPFAALPQSYDPPSHRIVSTNQRPVAADYPYYIGTSLNFDPGYRQTVITGYLAGHPAMTADHSAALQDDVTDELAAQLVPALLRAVRGTSLTGPERQAVAQLTRWHDTMAVDSAAASIWWTFLTTYLTDVFGPRWTRVPVRTDPDVLALSTLPIPLREALQRWTLHDPDNSAFTPPNGAHRDAPTVMRAAFTTAVTELAARLGPNPAGWTWGRLHSRQIPSLTGATGLGVGPYPADGDPWTVDAADGGMDSTFGPTWRMTVAWTGTGPPAAWAVYPGGQSEDPASPWYQNLVPLWRSRQTLPLAAKPGHDATWTMRGDRP
ncbi:MAG TPA: penicillin acylase family protein [Pseudonocardiaceae bacterium]|nr:penicillin acylase family protein [Pseudonocardiaceae bacterium]